MARNTSGRGGETRLLREDVDGAAPRLTLAANPGSITTGTFTPERQGSEHRRPDIGSYRVTRDLEADEVAWLHFLERLLGSFAWAAPEAAGFYYIDLSSEPPQVITFGSDPRDMPKVGTDCGPTGRSGCGSDGVFGPTALVDECEAYVAGRFQGYLEANGKPAPGWAWINSIAHGDLKAVLELAQATDRSGGPQAAVTDLAKQVLRIIDRGHETLQDLQLRVLIPLESALIETRPTAVPVDATQLRQAIKLASGSGLLP